MTLRSSVQLAPPRVFGVVQVVELNQVLGHLQPWRQVFKSSVHVPPLNTLGVVQLVELCG